MSEIIWKPMRTLPKGKKKIKLLGTTDTRLEEYSEIEGVWNKEVDCYTTKSGWVIAAVAWSK